jgi:hypothetical protein
MTDGSAGRTVSSRHLVPSTKSVEHCEAMVTTTPAPPRTVGIPPLIYNPAHVRETFHASLTQTPLLSGSTHDRPGPRTAAGR